MQYQQDKDNLTGATRTDGIIKRDGVTESFVPADPLNSDWRAYQDWLAAGNQPMPPGGTSA